MNNSINQYKTNKFRSIIFISLLASLVSNNRHSHNKHHKIVNNNHINDNNLHHIQNKIDDFIKATSNWHIKRWKKFLVYYLRATSKANKKWSAKSFEIQAKLWIKGNPKWWKSKVHWTQKQWRVFWNDLIILQVQTWARVWTLSKIKRIMTNVIDSNYQFHIGVPWRQLVSQFDQDHWFKQTQKWSAKRWAAFSRSWSQWFQKSSQNLTVSQWLSLIKFSRKINNRQLHILMNWNISSIRNYWLICQEKRWVEGRKWNAVQWRKYWGRWSSVLSRQGILTNWKRVIQMQNGHKSCNDQKGCQKSINQQMMKDYEDRISNMKEDMQDYQNKIEDIKEDIKDYRDRIEDIKEDIKAHVNENKDIQELLKKKKQEKKEQLKQKNNQIKDQMDHHEDEIKKIKDEIRGHIKDKEDLKELLRKKEQDKEDQIKQKQSKQIMLNDKQI